MPHRPHKRRWLLFVLIALLAVAGWWWWQRPRQMRLVAQFPGESLSHTPFPNVHGFLTEVFPDGKDILTFRDWHGKALWQVNLPEVHFPGKDDEQRTERAIYWSPGAQAVSANGHYFAIASPQKLLLQLQVWHDGMLDSDYMLPVDDTLYSYTQDSYNHFCPVQLHVDNHGRMLCIVPHMTRYNLYAISGGKMLAKGEYRANITLNDQHSSRLMRFSIGGFFADGNTMVLSNRGGFDYLALSIGNEIHAECKYHCPDPVNTLAVDGAVLTTTGKVYGPRGLIAVPSNNENESYDLFGHSTFAIFLKKGYQLFSAANDAHWGLPFRKGFQIYDISTEQMILCGWQPGIPKMKATFLMLGENIPLVGARCRELRVTEQYAHYFAVLSRSGRVCAFLPVVNSTNTVYGWTPGYTTQNGQSYDICFFNDVLSPDGHTLVYEATHQDADQYKDLLLFRW